MSRPGSSQHRLSVGNASSLLPLRGMASRSHSHSVSLGSVNPSNRINRRKSSNFTPLANSAAITAAVEGAAGKRRSSSSRAALASLNDGSYPQLPSSLPFHASVPEHASSGGSALVDGPSLSTFQGIENGQRLKTRRASEGTRLTKKEKAAAGDLKCEHCGKAYKHGSCLSKHLWEHTPQWQYTSKLLISKHQQVQLLEAASVLVQMNTEGVPNIDSDNSSSPAASGSSDRDEEYSSAETTPPPHVDAAYRDVKRHSGFSSAYSHSYQSALSESAPVADHAAFAHYRQWSASSFSRPQTAASPLAVGYRDEDPQDLAAAVGLLSCSYGTPKTGPVSMPADIPPVPALPAKYALSSSQNRGQPDVSMDDEGMDDESEDDLHPLPTRHYQNSHLQYRVQQHQQHDDDEGMFGKMDA